MAVGIENLTNIDTTDPTGYPNGNLKDNDGTGNGTPLDVVSMADIYATFDKLLRTASITASGDPDNETNGYQYIEALYWMPAYAGVTGLGSHWVNEGSGTYNNFERLLDRFGTVHLRGFLKRNDGSSGAGVKIATLPPAYRPAKTEIHMVKVYSIANGGAGIAYVTIEPNGDVTPQAYANDTNILDVLNAAGDYVSFDGISYVPLV